MTGAVKSINCTNCGAGLDVLGGGRVVTQVCGYCGAALDANDNYNVLSVYAGMQRPASPFRLGMTGKVDGVDFTIIGTLGQVERYDGQEWRWVDHMLYSPTHGYAWLTVEDGHTLLSRKVRDWPGGAFLTARGVNVSDSRPSRNWRGQSFTYYDQSIWKTDFAEGEFNWRANVGDSGETVTMMPGGAASEMLSYVQTPGQERELEITRYFPEAAAAFGAEPPTPIGVHPLQPYEPAKGKRFYMTWFGGLTAVSAALMLFLLVGGASWQTLFEGPPSDLPGQLQFEVSDTSRPVRLELRHQVSQAWSEWDIGITDPAGVPLADTGRGISYYYGGSGDDAWSEGSRFSSLTFQPTETGTYRLDLAMAEAASGGQASDRFRVRVREGHSNALWIVIATCLFGLAFLWAASSRWRHRAKRWSGSDWSDEDD